MTLASTDTSVPTRMVRLTQIYGIETTRERPVWVNPAHVLMVHQVFDKTMIVFGNDVDLRVSEPAEEVAAMLFPSRP